MTHDLEEAFSVSDRVAVMNRGRVKQYDSPVSIFTRPASPFVAEFVGHSNIISGTIERGDERGPILRSGEASVLRIPAGLTVGQKVRLAIPAHLLEVTAERNQADNCIPVRIQAASYLGTAVHYELDADGLLLHAEMPVHADGRLFGRGEQAFASWRAGDFIHLPASQS